MSFISESQLLPALLYMIALSVYAVTVKRLTIFSFVLVGLVLLEAIHLGLEHYMWYIYKTWNNYSAAYFLWYVGFALTDFLFVFLLFRTARMMNTQMEWISSFVTYVYLILGVVQVARYFDRVVYKTDFLVTMYKDGIPLLNTALSAAVFIFVFIEVFKGSLRFLHLKLGKA